jgi:O-antigen ligase
MAILAASVVLMLGSAALSFGAVYAWAYWPLLAACAAIGVLGWTRGRVTYIDRSLIWGLLAILSAVLVQLVPLSHAALLAMSPFTDAFLLDHDFLYATMSATGAPAHPLSIDPEATWQCVAFVVALGVLFLGLARGLTRRETQQIVAGVIVLGVVMALLGVIQRAISPGKIYGFRSAGAPFGPFANRNHFGGWMLMSLPLAIGYVSARSSRAMRGVKPGWRERLLWLSSSVASHLILTSLAILIMGVALVLTLSRSAILSFVIALATSAWFLTRGQMGSRRALTVGSLALVGLVSVGWVGIDRIVQKFAAADDTVPGERLTIWRDTLGIVRRFPLAGTGMNTFDTAMLAYESIDPYRYAGEAHNDYLQVAAEGGLLVAGPAAVMIALLARELGRRFREDVSNPMAFQIRAGAVTGLVAIGLQELVDFSLQVPGNAALFAVLCAIAIRKEGGNETVSRAGAVDGHRAGSGADRAGSRQHCADASGTAGSDARDRLPEYRHRFERVQRGRESKAGFHRDPAPSG